MAAVAEGSEDAVAEDSEDTASPGAVEAIGRAWIVRYHKALETAEDYGSSGALRGHD